MSQRVQTRKATQARRKEQVCRVVELKINESKLNLAQKETIDRSFVEARWWLNNIIANSGDIDTTAKEVVVVTPDGPETRELKVLHSQMKQDFSSRFIANCKSIAANKAKGRQVGRIRFTSEVNSLPIRAQAIRRVGAKCLNLPKFGKVYVHGTHQLEYKELANAVLVRRASGLYLMVTTYADKEVSGIKVTKSGVIKQKKKPKKDSVIGVDFGVAAAITTSDGEEINISVGESDTLKGRQGRLSEAEKGSNNWKKLKKQVRKEHEHVKNQRKDVGNKAIAYLQSKADVIVIQNDNIKGWQAGLFGKAIQRSALGNIKAKLIASGAIVVDRFAPTTKKCYYIQSYLSDNFAI